MIVHGQDETYDVSGYGLGEGLMLCTEWELKQLKQEIEGILNDD